MQKQFLPEDYHMYYVGLVVQYLPLQTHCKKLAAAAAQVLVVD